MRWVTRPVRPSPEPLPTVGIDRILVCRTSHSLGNSLLLTPLLAELEILYPGAEVDIVTQSPSAEELYGAYPAVRHLLRLPSRFPLPLPRVLGVVRRMRATRYDLAIDPDPRSKTDRFMLRLAHARFKVGYLGREKEGDVTHGSDVPAEIRHLAQMPVHLLRTVVRQRSGAPYPRADLRLSAGELAAGRERIAGVLATRPAYVDRPAMGIFANATGTKRLGEAWWSDMLDNLEALLPGHAFIEFTPVSGGTLLGNRYPTMYCGSPRRMAACFAQLDGFVSVDSGPMHLAWAAGAPTFGVFTGTDIAMWGPYGANGHALEGCRHTPRSIAEAVAGVVRRQHETLV